MTAVLTYLYADSVQTAYTVKSASTYYPIVNACRGNEWKGNGYSMQRQYETMLDTEYDKLIYTDAGDTLFLNTLDVPDDYILYAAERNCWPFPELAEQYPPTDSLWKYLNGGGCCGPTALLIEFYERYGLHKLSGQSSVQGDQAKGYLAAIKEGFPIKLDTECRVFQTLYRCTAEDFVAEGNKLRNKHTNTYPVHFHGNGRMDMSWLYDFYDKALPKV